VAANKTRSGQKARRGEIKTRGAENGAMGTAPATCAVNGNESRTSPFPAIERKLSRTDRTDFQLSIDFPRSGKLDPARVAAQRIGTSFFPSAVVAGNCGTL